MNFNNQSKKDFAKELKLKLMDSISLLDVYSRYKQYVQESSGKLTQSACVNPLCSSSDAFTFYPSVCKCFSCQESYNNIFDLYLAIHNSDDYYNALYTIARDFGAINEEEYNLCISNSYSRKNSNYKPKINQELLEEKKKEKEAKMKKCPSAKRQSDTVIHNVCKVIKELSPKVTGKVRYSLKKERGLTDEEIDKEFFILPKPSSEFYRKLFATIKERFGYEPKDLIGVPGFYSYDMNKILLVKRSGLGFFMSDSDGIVKGIHIRNYDEIDENGKMIIHDNKTDKNGNKINIPKYYWFTSERLPNGCGPGSPVDVLLSESKKANICFISEGKFKIKRIVKEFNSPAISVQGVGNWEGKIRPEISFIRENYNELKYVFCAYDSDLCFNFKIFNECNDMIEEELKDLNLKIKIAVWDYKLGKGLDDMIDNGHKDKLKSIYFDTFKGLFVPYMKEIKKRYPNTTITKILDSNKNEVDKDIIHEIYKDMVLNPLNIYCVN